MRNPNLHALMESFTDEAARRLAGETQSGADIPFELVAEPGGSAPLYCYRPLTARFIGQRLPQLSGLATYAPAARALEGLPAGEEYLQLHGESRLYPSPRERADAVLRVFLGRVFADRSHFSLDSGRFAAAYAELELALYEGRSVTTVVAPVLGLALEHGTSELDLGDGLSLVRGDAMAEAPREAVWAEGPQPCVLAVLEVAIEGLVDSPVTVARTRFRRLLSALRLFEHGGFSLGPLAWTRRDGGSWRPVALGTGGRSRSVASVAAGQADELRAFHDLVARRTPLSGAIAWALARYEMGCERLGPLEALSDYLLALRALLEPEGPASGRLAGRLAAICAQPQQRAALAERAARAVALERTLMTGSAVARPGADALISELAEHLRALLRDLICGHLYGDVCALADELLVETAAAA